LLGQGGKKETKVFQGICFNQGDGVWLKLIFNCQASEKSPYIFYPVSKKFEGIFSARSKGNVVSIV